MGRNAFKPCLFTLVSIRYKIISKLVVQFARFPRKCTCTLVFSTTRIWVYKFSILQYSSTVFFLTHCDNKFEFVYYQRCLCSCSRPLSLHPLRRIRSNPAPPLTSLRIRLQLPQVHTSLLIWPIAHSRGIRKRGTNMHANKACFWNIWVE